MLRALVYLSLAFAATAAETPSAQDILSSVRMRQTRQQIDLQGQLRQSDQVVLFHLVQNGPTVRYIFSDPDETLQLELGETESRLEEISKSGAEKIAPAELDHKVRG